MKFQGTNFQSLKEFDLDISGLTVIVGPSNRGKSAVFRALRGLFRNELPPEYVRTHTTGLEIIATIDGKAIIARRNTKGSTKYWIDGEEFKKLNQTVPQELKAFGMNEVKIGTFTIDPIFARQNGKQFLIDRETTSPIELNTILGAFASTEKLEAGKKSANLEITQRNADAKTLAEEVSSTETRKGQLEGVFSAIKLVSEELYCLEPDIKAIELKKHWVGEAKGRQELLWPLQSALSRLAVPDTQEVETLSVGRRYAIQATNSFRITLLCRRIQANIDGVVANWEEAAVPAKQIQALEEFMIANANYVAHPIQPVTDIIFVANQQLATIKGLMHSIILLTQCQLLLERFTDVEKQLQQVDADTAVVVIQQHNVQKQAQENQKITCPQCGLKFDPLHICEVSDARTA